MVPPLDIQATPIHSIHSFSILKILNPIIISKNIFVNSFAFYVILLNKDSNFLKRLNKDTHIQKNRNPTLPVEQFKTQSLEQRSQRKTQNL